MGTEIERKFLVGDNQNDGLLILFPIDEPRLKNRIADGLLGVSLMDNDLYLALKDKRDSQQVLEEAFRESERRRALGQTYTQDDYLREHGDDN